MMIIFRYWAITDPINYPAKMTSKKVGRYIAGVWFCSSLISFPAIVWWRATQEGPALKTQCLFTEDIGYRIFSSIISFYAPACFMLFAYYKIYKEAKRHTKSLVNGRMILKEGKLPRTLFQGGPKQQITSYFCLCECSGTMNLENGTP